MKKNNVIPQMKIDSVMKKKWEDAAEKENRNMPHYIRNAVEFYRKSKDKRILDNIIDYEILEKAGIIKKR